MFESRSLAIASIAIGDIDPDQRNHDFQQLLRLHQNAEVTSEGFVAGSAT